MNGDDAASGRAVIGEPREAPMSNLDMHPSPQECRAIDAATAIEVLHARDVPLGGPRAIGVRRTLPQRRRSLIGAWCFADHYGPEDLAAGGSPMDVPPHPHTGLATVSWLFSGEIEHRDSGGVHALVRPGELNLMVAGAGICHSEVSTPAATVLHGVQLWLALPDATRDGPREFHHHRPEPLELDGAVARVFLGTLAGAGSPVPTHSPLLGAELVLAPGASLLLPVDPAFEHGVLLDVGDVAVCGAVLDRGDLAYQGIGHDALEIVNRGDGSARVVLLGGEPFGEEILMWWNFVGRSHDEIAGYREQWQAEAARFGAVEGYTGPVTRLPVPTLPGLSLRPRRNPPPHATGRLDG